MEKRVSFSFQKELKDRLEEAAKKENRNLTNYIKYLLKNWSKK
jgi:predicted DNA-binding protein